MLKKVKLNYFIVWVYSLYNHTSHNYSQHISAASGKDYICTICTALSALWPGYNRYGVRARKSFQPRIRVDKTKSNIGVGISICKVFVLISWSQNTELISATSLPAAFCLLRPGRPWPENYDIIRFKILFAYLPLS